MSGDRILGLDLNGTTGWACNRLDSGGEFKAPPLLGHFRVDAGGDGQGICFLELERCAALLIEKMTPDIIAYEAPLPIAAFSNMMNRKDQGQAKHVTMNTQHVLKTCGYAAIIRKVAAQYGYAEDDVVPVNVQDARGYFMGNRYAKKDAIMVRCTQMRWPVANDHEADACCAWAYAHSRLRILGHKRMVAEALEKAAAE